MAATVDDVVTLLQQVIKLLKAQAALSSIPYGPGAGDVSATTKARIDQAVADLKNA